REYLATFADVVARDREADRDGNDPVLSTLSRERFDEVWLLGVDGGDGLSPKECAAINAFQRDGGGLLTVRDHGNMALGLRQRDGVGAAHFYKKKEFSEPDPERQCPDDRDSPSIAWPNYHSGNNGDYQRVVGNEPLHPLLARGDAPTGRIERF